MRICVSFWRPKLDESWLAPSILHSARRNAVPAPILHRSAVLKEFWKDSPRMFVNSCLNRCFGIVFGTILVLDLKIDTYQIAQRMKRTVFVLSLLAMILTGFSGLNAQSLQNSTPLKPVVSGMPVVTAYVNSFENAVNQGNLQMAQAHRTKLVAFMERDIQSVTASNVATNLSKPTDMVTEKAVLADLKALTLTDAASLNSAKALFSKLEDYDKTYTKRTPANN